MTPEMQGWLTVVFAVEKGVTVSDAIRTKDWSIASWSNAIHERDAALSQAEAYRVDAERYRWLRECSSIRSDRGGVVINWPKRINGKLIDGDRTLAAESLDSAIDAARKPA